MSTTIDEKVVSMRFDNKKFEANAKQSIDTLQKIDDKVNSISSSYFDNSNLSNVINSIDLSKIGQAADVLNKKFSIFGVIGDQVLRNITNSAMGLFKKLNAATIGQIKSGGIQRAMNLEKAQFQIEGLVKETGAWEKVLDDINYGVQDTAYGLDEAAVVASQLLTSNIKIGDEMKASLRAVSGVAAITSSSYSDIGQIFTVIASNGKLTGMELSRLSSRGINAAGVLAEQLGKTEAEIRKMVTKGQIDFKTFSKAMDDAFGEHAKDANETFTGALSNVKSALSRIGADIATPSLKELRDVFNSIRPVINELRKALAFFIEDVNSSVAKISKWLQDLFNGVDSKQLTFILHDVWRIAKNIFSGIYSIVSPIIQAFEEIVPKTTVNTLSDLTLYLSKITSNFHLTESAANGLKNIVKVLIIPLQILGKILKELYVILSPLASAFGNFVNDILSTFSESETVISFFNNITNYTNNFINDLLSGTNFAGKAVLGLKNIIFDFSSWVSGHVTISNVFENIANAAEKAWGIIKKVFGYIKNLVVDVLSSLGESLSLNVAAGGGLIFILTNTALAVKHWIDAWRISLGNIVELPTKLKLVLINVEKTLAAFTMNIKAGMLKDIAAAILMFASALFILSLVPTEKVASSLGALTVVIGEALASLFAIFKIQSIKGIGGFGSLLSKTVNMASFLSVLIGFCVAVIVLVASLKILSTFSYEELAKGLIGSFGVILLMLFMVNSLSKIQNMPTKIFSSLLGMAISLLIITIALKKVAGMDYESITKGLIVLISTLVMLSLFFKATQNVSNGFMSVIALALGLLILSSVLKKIGDIKPEKLIIGVLGLISCLSLILITYYFINKISKNATNIGGAITALIMITIIASLMSGVISKISKIDTDKLIISIIGITVVLSILVGVLFILCNFKQYFSGAQESIASLLLLSIVINIVSNIVVSLSKLKINELLIGVLGFALIIGAIIGIIFILNKLNSMGMSLGKSLSSILMIALAGIALTVAITPFILLSSIPFTKLILSALSMMSFLAIIVGALYLISFIALPLLIASGVLLVAGIALGVALGVLSLSILGLTFAISMISKLDASKVKENLVAISEGLFSFTNILKEAGLNWLPGAIAIIMLATALTILAPALMEFDNINNINNISKIMKELAKGFKSFSDTLKSFKLTSVILVSPLVSIGEAISLLAPALKELALVNVEDIPKMLTPVAEAFKSFAETLGSVPFWGAKNRAEGVGILISNIGNLGDGVKSFTLNTEGIDFGTALTSIGRAFKDFGTALSNAPLIGSSSRGEGISSLINSISTLGTELPKFHNSVSGLDWQHIAETIGESYSKLGASLHNAPAIGAASRGEGVATIVGAISNLKDGLDYFSTTDANMVKNVTGTISESLSSFGSTLYSVPFFGAENRANSLLTLIDGIYNLTDSIKYFSTIPIEKSSEALTSIGTAFKDFATSIKTVPFWGTESRTSGILALVDGVNSLTPSLVTLGSISGDATSDNLTAIGKAFMDFGEAISNTPFWNSDSRSEALVSIINSIDTLVPSLLSLKDIGRIGINTSVSAITSALVELCNSLGEFTEFNKQIDTLNSLSVSLNSIIPVIISLDTSITDGFSQKIISFSTALLRFLNSLLGFEDISVKLQHIESLMFNVGENAVQGIIDGLLSKEEELKTTAEILAKSIPNEIADVLVIRSPSRLLKSMGENAVLGFLNGFSDNDEVIDTAKSFGYETIESLAEGIKNGEPDANKALDSIMNKIQDVLGGEANLEDLIRNFQIYPKELEKASDKYKNSLDDNTESTDEFDKTIEEASDSLYSSSPSSLGGSASKAKKEIDTLTDIMDYASDVVGVYGVKIGVLNKDLSEKIPDGMEIAKKSVMDFAERLYDAKVKAGSMDFISENEVNYTQKRLEAIKKSFTETYKSVENAIKNQMDIFSEFKKDQELTSEDLINNLKSQISGVKDWSNMLVKLSDRGLNEGLLQKLGELGPQSYDKVRAFTEMTSEQLAEYNALYAESLSLPKSETSKIIAGCASAGNEMGANLLKGLQNGLDKGNDETNSITEKNAAEKLDVYKKGLDEASPSKATEEMGINLLIGLQNGITNQTQNNFIRSKIIVFCNNILKIFEKYINKDEGQKLGEYYMQGFENGIDKMTNKVITKTNDLAKLINNTLANGIGVESPSKITYGFGRYYMIGFANGMEDNYEKPLGAAETIASLLTKTIQSVAEDVEDDMNMYPVITPVVNLDEVKNGANRMQQLMGYSRTGYNIASNARSAGIQNELKTIPNEPMQQNYNFYQYNNSPKALSRIDIYRQTKSQFAMFKGAVAR